MRLVRRGTSGPVRANGRAQDLAAAAREMMSHIIGDKLAQDVANNAAMAFIDDDEIYENDQSFAEIVREALVNRLKNPPRTYRAEPLTMQRIERAVTAIANMKTAAELGLSEEDLAEQTRLLREVVDETLDEERLGKAVTNWFESPINDYGTPYVSHPLDFTPAEQGEFVDFVRQPRLVTREEQKAKLREIIAARGQVKPNRRRSSRSSRASTLNGRASMDTTHVGRDVDPDRYTGARGKSLDEAMDRYETFHAKRPLRVVELDHDLPTQVVCIGQVISTMYRTDKWHKDGDDEDYKHVHDNSRGGKDREYEFGKGVLAYEPVREASRSVIESGGKRSKAARSNKPTNLPVRAPRALSLLGYCLGIFVHRFDDDEIYEINPRGCYLFCSPKGDMLAIYSPDAQADGSRGFMMIMAGGGLRVLKDGIDG